MERYNRLRKINVFVVYYTTEYGEHFLDLTLSCYYRACARDKLPVDVIA
jgi:hypothetical protein